VRSSILFQHNLNCIDDQHCREFDLVAVTNCYITIFVDAVRNSRRYG
jgi:hypothetical protein